MSEATLYKDSRQSVTARVDDLLAGMTLDEKLAQIGCVWPTQLVENDAFSPARARRIIGNGFGQVGRLASSTALRPQESAAFVNTVQRFLREETRLGIPTILHEESCAGFMARDATQFPQAIGLASTWDPDLVAEIAGVIREQMLAVGARQTLAPVLDVARDPRWGRTEETFGEDPYLVSRIGVAYVRGIQGESLRRGVAATAKHFLGYGFSEGGLNHAPAHIGPRELREVFARPFAAAIEEARVATVMNAYHDVDGLPCGGSREILDELLRGELGFDGLVVADYYAVILLASFHKIAADRGEAGRRALEAGIDVELPQIDCYGAPLRERIENGDVPLAWLDRSVRRILRLKLELGLFEDPYVDAERAPAVFDTAPQRALALRAAEQSIVLLKNDGVLPLDASLGSIAVIGPAADDIRLLQGDYSYPAHVEIVYKSPPRRGVGEGDITPASDRIAFAAGPYFVPMVSPLEGIRAAVSRSTEVRHARGCDVTGDDRSGFADAVDVARRSAVAVVAVGGRSGLVPDCTSGEFRDASSLGLTGVQQELVEAVVATGTPTVVVLINGRPLALPWIAANVPAVVEAWLPGEEGGHAIARVLFGAVNPSGRLPVSIPRSVGQVPIYYAHKSGGGRSQMLGDYIDSPTKPLFPFGHGLAYTHFEYAGLEVSPSECRTDEKIRVSIEVKNSGERDGEEVVQLYLRDAIASLTRPVKQLVGFKRIELGRGESRRLTFTVDPSQLAFYDARMRLVIEPGTIEVMVGASSEDIRARGAYEIVGDVREIRQADIIPTVVEVS
jgi:beta-glucosidase